MNTINELTNEYQKWCEEHGYPQMSADELLVEFTDSQSFVESKDKELLVQGENREWLKSFITRWDEAVEPPQFVQDITEDYGFGTAVQDETVEDTGLGIYMKYGSNDYCELKDHGNCSDDGILWQADDMGSPYICTNHFFPQEQLGYEFVEM